jgi:hypothetical protein
LSCLHLLSLPFSSLCPTFSPRLGLGSMGDTLELPPIPWFPCFLPFPSPLCVSFCLFGLILGTPAFWAFLWFVGFCYLANQWQVSKPKDNPLNEGTDAARAAIAFSFFSIFTWVSTAPTKPTLAVTQALASDLSHTHTGPCSSWLVPAAWTAQVVGWLPSQGRPRFGIGKPSQGHRYPNHTDGWDLLLLL